MTFDAIRTIRTHRATRCRPEPSFSFRASASTSSRLGSFLLREDPSFGPLNHQRSCFGWHTVTLEQLNHVGRVDFRFGSNAIPKKNRHRTESNQSRCNYLRYAMMVAFANNVVASQANRATSDMIALAFFFLLCPGEYTATKSDTASSLSRMQDVQLRLSTPSGRSPKSLNLTLASSVDSISISHFFDRFSGSTLLVRVDV